MTDKDLGVGTADVAQAVPKVELTIKGDVEVLRLRPGDTIVVTVHDERATLADMDALRERVKLFFPDNQVLIVDGSSASLSIQRTQA